MCDERGTLYRSAGSPTMLSSHLTCPEIPPTPTAASRESVFRVTIQGM